MLDIALPSSYLERNYLFHSIILQFLLKLKFNSFQKIRNLTSSSKNETWNCFVPTLSLRWAYWNHLTCNYLTITNIHYVTSNRNEKHVIVVNIIISIDVILSQKTEKTFQKPSKNLKSTPTNFSKPQKLHFNLSKFSIPKYLKDYSTLNINTQ